MPTLSRPTPQSPCHLPQSQRQLGQQQPSLRRIQQQSRALRRSLALVFVCLLTSSCAWSTNGRGPVLWLSYNALDQSDDQPDYHTPTDPMPEYHHTGEQPVLSIEPSTAGIIMFLPAAVLDILALPFTALYAAFDQSWRVPEKPSGKNTR